MDDTLAGQTCSDVRLALLADVPPAMGAVADMRWQEWGRPPEPEDPAWWLETTIREAGQEDLPVTFVALSSNGDVLGAVGLDTYDLDERRATSPWITGMIVRRNSRRRGVGRALLAQLEAWAAEHGVTEAWVGTELAAEFYARSGWTLQETFASRTGERISVLHKQLG